MRPPFSLYQPLNPLYPQTHSSCCTLSPLKFALHAESFYEHCQGSQPGNQNVENGTGKQRLGGVCVCVCLCVCVCACVGGTHLYSRSHRHRRCTSSEAKIEERIPEKTNQEDWERRQRRSPLILATMGHRLRMSFRASVCRNVKFKHKHTASSPSVGGMCRCGTRGRDQIPSRRR